MSPNRQQREDMEAGKESGRVVLLLVYYGKRNVGYSESLGFILHFLQMHMELSVDAGLKHGSGYG